jgi:hypothetical protein
MANGPYACVSKDDVRQMVNHPSDKLVLKMVERVKAYLLTTGTLVQVACLRIFLTELSYRIRTRRAANKDLETQREDLFVSFERWTDGALEPSIIS